METIFKAIGTPQAALSYLRQLTTTGQVVTWETLETISRLHFEGLIHQINNHFAVKNSTGLASLFADAADKLLLALPLLLTSEYLVDQEQGSRQAHLIVLLRKCAGAVQALHRREAVRYDFT